MVRPDVQRAPPKRRVAILISGRGSNMAALIKAAVAEDFPAEISVVISNRADAAGLAPPTGGGYADAPQMRVHG